MYFNFNYLVFMLPAIIITLIVQLRLKSTYNKFSKIRNSRGITGAQAAQEALRNAGVYNVRIEQTSGNLTDHFSPNENVIRLSKDVYEGTTIAAIGIACHEVGHAIQYDREYAPIKLRNMLIPVTNIGSKLGLILIVLGIIFANTFYFSETLFLIGIILYSLVVVLQLVTLPVEFNASKRAMESIRSSGMLRDDECVGARKVLSAAALTYVAALISSIMTLLYYVALANRRRR
ncbi:MAG: zinc metallopeptidase [Clostridia bacterium]|nr:zinc metallopeptidase [Clostridia bacterium]